MHQPTMKGAQRLLPVTMAKTFIMGTSFAIAAEVGAYLFGEAKKEITDFRSSSFFYETIKENNEKFHDREELRRLLFKDENKEVVDQRKKNNFLNKNVFFKNFIFGSVGYQFIFYFFSPRMNAKKNISSFSRAARFIYSALISIVPYYLFCNLYDELRVDTVFIKLRSDFFLLAPIKMMVDFSFLKTLKTIESNILRTNKQAFKEEHLKMILRKISLNYGCFSFVWILVLSSVYEGRVLSLLN